MNMLGSKYQAIDQYFLITIFCLKLINSTRANDMYRTVSILKVALLFAATK